MTINRYYFQDKYALVRDTDKSKSVFTISDLEEAKKIGGLKKLYVFMEIDPEQLAFLKDRPGFRLLDLTYTIDMGSYAKSEIIPFMEIVPDKTVVRYKGR